MRGINTGGKKLKSSDDSGSLSRFHRETLRPDKHFQQVAGCKVTVPESGVTIETY